MYIKRFDRVQRVAQEIQKKLSVIIHRKVRDPRIGLPTISGVKVSKDLKNAKIFITFLDKHDPVEIGNAITVLQKMSCFMRFLLAHTICLRVVPVLLFKYDRSLLEGCRVSRLVEKLK